MFCYRGGGESSKMAILALRNNVHGPMGTMRQLDLVFEPYYNMLSIVALVRCSDIL